MKTNNKNLISLLKTQKFYFKKFDKRRKEFKGCKKVDFEEAQKKHIQRELERSRTFKPSLLELYRTVKDFSSPDHGSYQKVVMYGFTHLYLCSPVYGHGDYNKSILCKIEGNERLCELLYIVSKKTAKNIE